MEKSEALRLYDALIATNAAVERKGDTVPFTSLNGHNAYVSSLKPKPATTKPGAKKRR